MVMVIYSALVNKSKINSPHLFSGYRTKAPGSVIPVVWPRQQQHIRTKFSLCDLREWAGSVLAGVEKKQSALVS